MNKNFLNNQNYILWKSEKKKLLSKFFIELKYKKLLMLLTLFSNIFFNWKLLFLIPIIVYIIFYIYSENFGLKILFWIVSLIFIIVLFMALPHIT